jgi:hypothetical protein
MGVSSVSATRFQNLFFRPRGSPGGWRRRPSCSGGGGEDVDKGGGGAGPTGEDTGIDGAEEIAADRQAPHHTVAPSGMEKGHPSREGQRGAREKQAPGQAASAAHGDRGGVAGPAPELMTFPHAGGLQRGPGAAGGLFRETIEVNPNSGLPVQAQGILFATTVKVSQHAFCGGPGPDGIDQREGDRWMLEPGGINSALGASGLHELQEFQARRDHIPAYGESQAGSNRGEGGPQETIFKVA